MDVRHRIIWPRTRVRIGAFDTAAYAGMKEAPGWLDGRSRPCSERRSRCCSRRPPHATLVYVKEPADADSRVLVADDDGIQTRTAWVSAALHRVAATAAGWRGSRRVTPSS